MVFDKHIKSEVRYYHLVQCTMDDFSQRACKKIKLFSAVLRKCCAALIKIYLMCKYLNKQIVVLNLPELGKTKRDDNYLELLLQLEMSECPK